MAYTTGMRAGKRRGVAAECGKDWEQSRAELCLQTQSLRHFYLDTTHSLQLHTSCPPLKKPQKTTKQTNKQTKLFAASKLIYTVLWRINPTTAQLSSFLGHHMLEKHFASTTTMGAWIICISTRCISEKTVLDTFGTWYLGEKWDGREAVAMNSCCCRVGRLK